MSKYMNRAAGRGAKSHLHMQRQALAVGVAMVLAAATSSAQEANTASSDAVELDTVQVTGLRGSLMRAQDLKQDAEQIIDSVTAQDIGALPDRSVTETLKRVSGVTVTGFAARDDTDHFSAEGSGVMIPRPDLRPRRTERP
jgi:Outer membrane receptor for ferrienterochelin and colicins